MIEARGRGRRKLGAAVRLAAPLALACATSALAAGRAPPPASSPKIELPLDTDRTAADWRSPPTSEQLWREYPPLARMLSLQGSAKIRCQAEIDGRVDDCKVLDEDPIGFGFGAAALRMTAYFTMNPATVDGRPTASPVTIPLRFAMEGADAPPAEPPTPPASPQALDRARQIVALQDYAGRMRAAWQTQFDQESARSLAESGPDQAKRISDALHLAMDDVVAWDTDRRAHDLAARLSQADLDATAAYLATPAGRAWSAAEAVTERRDGAMLMRRFAEAARARLQLTAAPVARPPASASAR